MKLPGRPARLGLARDFPLPPGFAERRVEAGEQRLQDLLPGVADDVDLGVTGDVAELDMWHALVDKAVADAAVNRLG